MRAGLTAGDDATAQDHAAPPRHGDPAATCALVTRPVSAPDGKKTRSVRPPDGGCPHVFALAAT
ncbi:hypothetical protein ACFWN1_22210 [Streptomyces sp. NPDC058459]|uniref:hypothetical protein n=1 Tax=Streptomyces sp. NPDC058459 TaxID=3346508 RepID=UPI003662792D